jgi:hypothetical protein
MKQAQTPAILSITSEENDHGTQYDSKKYLSLIMSLMYLARLSRPDILWATTYLATKSSNPTIHHYKHAIRIIRYLAGTPNFGYAITNPDFQLRLYADASHGLHNDGKGHGGLIITLGSSPIFVRSYKLKCITRSSSESELLVTLDEGVTYLPWIRSILDFVGISPIYPAIAYQDNKSTIIMSVNGGSFSRTKHLVIKQNYIREQVQERSLYLKYLPTKSMIADLLTKPHGFEALKQFLLMVLYHRPT